MKASSINIFDTLNFDVLNEREMNAVLGGKRRNPKSRDKDHFDEEDED